MVDGFRSDLYHRLSLNGHLSDIQFRKRTPRVSPCFRKYTARYFTLGKKDITFRESSLYYV